MSNRKRLNDSPQIHKDEYDAVVNRAQSVAGNFSPARTLQGRRVVRVQTRGIIGSTPPRAQQSVLQTNKYVNNQNLGPQLQRSSIQNNSYNLANHPPPVPNSVELHLALIQSHQNEMRALSENQQAEMKYLHDKHQAEAMEMRRRQYQELQRLIKHVPQGGVQGNWNLGTKATE